jgi:hypothetical protein
MTLSDAKPSRQQVWLRTSVSITAANIALSATYCLGGNVYGLYNRGGSILVCDVFDEAARERTPELPAYKKDSAREIRLATDDGCHFPPWGDLNPRRFNSAAIDRNVLAP